MRELNKSKVWNLGHTRDCTRLQMVPSNTTTRAERPVLASRRAAIENE